MTVWLSFRLRSSGIREFGNSGIVWFFTMVVAVIDVRLSLIRRILWSASSITSAFRWDLTDQATFTMDT